MSKRKIMSIIGLGLNALLIIFIFLPFYEYRLGLRNFWEVLKQILGDELAVIYLVELIVAMILLVLQICGVLKDTKLALMPIGFVFTICLATFFAALNNEGMEYFKVGLYLNLITSIASVIILGIGGLLSNDRKPKYGYAPKIVGYDPETGKPIYEKPKTIVSYDPHTGEPIYK